MAEAPYDWLIEPTTYRVYCERLLGGLLESSPDLLPRFKAKEAKIASKLKSGDELWEWRQVGGPFSSSGGLAILRDGLVVEWWREWVS